MARYRSWWNGKWGRLARRDVIIHHEEKWYVEAREGGPEGRSKFYPANDADDALSQAERFIKTPDGAKWREMT
jgi:hypothetical protein